MNGRKIKFQVFDRECYFRYKVSGRGSKTTGLLRLRLRREVPSQKV